MVKTFSKSLTLEEFLKLLETKPASEYINGEVVQKPIPKSRHSRLQGKFTTKINHITEEKQIAYAFPELRYTFGGRSIVPDVAILPWNKIELHQEEEPLDNVAVAPHWTIEILSPEQSYGKYSSLLESWLSA